MIRQNGFLPPREKLPQQPARKRSHSASIGRMVASDFLSPDQLRRELQAECSVRSYALPFPFPAGEVWAAIKHGVVINMVYMAQPEGDDVPYGVFRQRSRAELAKQGEVWSGRVVDGRFVAKFESTDVRRGGSMNTARVVDR